jgi:hypothetical protein
MLKRYFYDLSDIKQHNEYNALCDKLRACGHRLVKRWERDAPPEVLQVFQMIDCYMTERGALVWPWVEFHRETYGPEIRRGYYLDGVDPLPNIPEISDLPLPCKVNKRSRMPTGRAAKAARWFFNHAVANRKDAALKFGVTVSAVTSALNRLYSDELIPYARPGLKGEAANMRPPTSQEQARRGARWLRKNMTGTVRQAAHRYGITDEMIEEAFRVMYPDIRPPFKSTTAQALEWLNFDPSRTIKQAADRYGLSYSTVYKAVRGE